MRFHCTRLKGLELLTIAEHCRGQSRRLFNRGLQPVAIDFPLRIPLVLRFRMMTFAVLFAPGGDYSTSRAPTKRLPQERRPCVILPSFAAADTVGARHAVHANRAPI
jgi:hypothetical protein